MQYSVVYRRKRRKPLLLLRLTNWIAYDVTSRWLLITYQTAALTWSDVRKRDGRARLWPRLLLVCSGVPTLYRWPPHLEWCCSYEICLPSFKSLENEKKRIRFQFRIRRRQVLRSFIYTRIVTTRVRSTADGTRRYTRVSRRRLTVPTTAAREVFRVVRISFSRWPILNQRAHGGHGTRYGVYWNPRSNHKLQFIRPCRWILECNKN